MTIDITQLLIDASSGNDAALDNLLGNVYGELRELAHRQLRRLCPGDTFQTTVLVHEAYLKMFDKNRVDVGCRAHFFALAARAMRQILVDRFRRSNADRRGGGVHHICLEDAVIPTADRGDIILSVDRALSRLAVLDPRQAKVVECRFFGGMTEAEIGQVIGVSDRTARKDWRKARAWLARELSEENS